MSDSIFLAVGESEPGAAPGAGLGAAPDAGPGTGPGAGPGDVSLHEDCISMVIQPTEHARGPWDPQALHGGAPAALVTDAFQRMQPGAELSIARLGFEYLRPVPLAPLTLSTRIVRPGRRVQELAAELTTAPSDDRPGGELVCRASALRVQAIPAEVDAALSEATDATTTGALPRALAPPDSGKPVRFALNDDGEPSFAASAMEMRWLDDPRALGPARVWMRLRYPLLAGQTLTSLARLAASADFGNGIGAALPFARFLFINADLTIHLQRQPHGEWIGVDAHTLLPSGGSGLAESVLHDVHGPVGRAFQTLVVQPR